MTDDSYLLLLKNSGSSSGREVGKWKVAASGSFLDWSNLGTSTLEMWKSGTDLHTLVHLEKTWNTHRDMLPWIWDCYLTGFLNQSKLFTHYFLKKTVFYKLFHCSQELPNLESKFPSFFKVQHICFHMKHTNLIHRYSVTVEEPT